MFRASMPTRKPDSRYFEVRKSKIQGRGAFATRAIRKGTRLIEYVGERISQRVANTRYVDDDMKRHHTFLFSVDAKTCIDAAVDGNDARFINHSCDPNCEALLEDGRIFIYAIRTIPDGAELSYDYQYIVQGPIDAATLRMYVCRCGAPSCRGSILKPKRRAAAKKSAPEAKTATKPRSAAQTKSVPKTKTQAKPKTKTKARARTGIAA